MKRGKAANRHLDFYLGIPVLNFLATFRQGAVLPGSPKRIGLLFNPALGDTLLASAATQDIRSIYPRAKVILFATRANVAAARLLPGIDSIEILPIMRPLESIRILRQKHLDLMIDFSSWQRITALYTLMSGAHFTVGFERKKQYRHRGYHVAIPHRGDCHEVENMRRMTRWLGAKTHAAPLLLIPEGPQPGFDSSGKRPILFHAWASGTLRSLREWPEERWVSLAKQLTEPGQTFLLTGSPDDEPRCRILRDMLRKEGISAEILIGEDGIAGVGRALQQSKMLVSVNTGIMHLGAILGVPTVALNGPNSANRWGPVGPRVANVETSDGSGGFLDLGFEFQGRNVMRNISVDDVMRAVRQLHPAQARSGAAGGS